MVNRLMTKMKQKKYQTKFKEVVDYGKSIFKTVSCIQPPQPLLKHFIDLPKINASILKPNITALGTKITYFVFLVLLKVKQAVKHESKYFFTYRSINSNLVSIN